MEGTEPRDHQVSPGTDAEASSSSGAASGKAGKMPSQEGEIMDIEYFSEHGEGKKKRRRGRLIIFVDESEERTRWVPWVLLAAVIVGAVVAAVVIIKYAVNTEDGTQSSAAKRVDLNGGEYTQYQDCASMMARLRPTSQQHIFSPREALSAHQSRWTAGVQGDEAIEDVSTTDGQHDIVVPLVDESIARDSAVTTSDGDGFIYTGSGTKVKVISTGHSRRAPGVASNATSTVATLDLETIDAFQFTDILEVTNAEGSLSIAYGLGATFQIEQLFLPPFQGDPQLLAVVGSATNAAPVFPGPSPKLIFESVSSDGYVSSDFRPFNTSVLALVNISDPTNPAVVSISEFEGEFVTIAHEQSHYWVFVRSSAHVPEDHSSGDDSGLTMDIMPLFRNLPVAADNTGIDNLQWQHMGDCLNVQQLELGVPRVGNNHLLAAIPVLVSDPQLERQVGVVYAADMHLSVQGWATGMVPVLIAPSPDRRNLLNLYVAESIRYTAQVTGSSTESDSSVITAVSYFRLSGGNMSFTNYTINVGQVPFQDAMQFLQDPPRLSLLTSQYGDSTGGVLRSSLTIYSPTLSQEAQSVGQFRDRQPGSAIYPTNDHVFISFTVQSQPLVQVLPTKSATDTSEDASTVQSSRRAGVVDVPQQSVQRLLVLEFVDLMKAIVINNDSSQSYILLIAGAPVPEVDDGTGAVATPKDPDAILHDHQRLQFSLYSYTPGASSNIAVLATVAITSSSLDSEAFLDPRAALLFQIPDDVEGVAYFALPVVITEPNSGLLQGLGCDVGAQGFSGTLIWRLTFAYTARGGFADSVDVQPLAAVPASGSCGYVGTAAYEDVAVKRIRSFEYNGELHLTMLSRCSIATVPWASVTGAAASATAAAGTWPKIQPQTESLFAKNCPELPV